MISRTDSVDRATSSGDGGSHLRRVQRLLPDSRMAGPVREKEVPEYFSTGDTVQDLAESPLGGAEEGLIALIGAIFSQVTEGNQQGPHRAV